MEISVCVQEIYTYVCVYVYVRIDTCSVFVYVSGGELSSYSGYKWIVCTDLYEGTGYTGSGSY